MIFTLEKESLLNSLRIVEKASVSKGIQPVLSNILIEAINTKLYFYATDLDISIMSKTDAKIEKNGKITLPAKKLTDIVSKLDNNDIKFEINTENNVATIISGKSKFELLGISANEFPSVLSEKDVEDKSFSEIEIIPFIKGIKYTVYAAASSESRNIISGVFCSTDKDKLEMAATDGNRLAKIVENIKENNEADKKFVIPSKTLLEIQRIASLIDDKTFKIYIESSKIIIKTENIIITSRLLEGEYPPYKQLIPVSCPKEAIINRDKLISAIERVSVMVNERTNIIRFTFNKDNLTLKAETPESGASEDIIDIEFTDSEELVIAFNYKYILDSIKIMESDNIKVGLNGSLSATILKPDSADNYLCLVMPIQIEKKEQ